MQTHRTVAYYGLVTGPTTRCTHWQLFDSREFPRGNLMTMTGYRDASIFGTAALLQPTLRGGINYRSGAIDFGIGKSYRRQK